MIMPMSKFITTDIVRVHPVHLMNTDAAPSIVVVDHVPRSS